MSRKLRHKPAVSFHIQLDEIFPSFCVIIQSKDHPTIYLCCHRRHADRFPGTYRYIYIYTDASRESDISSAPVGAIQPICIRTKAPTETSDTQEKSINRRDTGDVFLKEEQSIDYSKLKEHELMEKIRETTLNKTVSEGRLEWSPT